MFTTNNHILKSLITLQPATRRETLFSTSFYHKNLRKRLSFQQSHNIYPNIKQHERVTNSTSITATGQNLFLFPCQPKETCKADRTVQEKDEERHIPAWDDFKNKATKLFTAFLFQSPTVVDPHTAKAEPPIDVVHSVAVVSHLIATELIAGVVRVFSDHEQTYFNAPWLKDRRQSVHTGFIIEGRRVLTCAICMKHNSKVTIRKHGSTKTYQARVLAIGHECNIAMLTVDDEEFWRKVKPLELGDLPALKDELITLGYLQGEDNIFTQNCFVTHLDMATYSYWPVKLSTLQLSEELKNPVLGGPVLDIHGKCVGMTNNRSVNIIPIPVIKHFVEDYDTNGAYSGFPTFAFKWQKMENLDMRRYYMKMDHYQKGVLLRKLHPDYPETLLLRPNDIILSIDGVDIANDGTVVLRTGQRVPFSYLIMQKYIGDEVSIEVLRNSVLHQFKIKLAAHKQFRATDLMGRLPQYYIIGGLVFTTLSWPFLRDKMFEDYHDETLLPENVIYESLYGQRVVLCEMLKAGINHGYAKKGIINSQVMLFNDKPVESLKSLVTMVEGCCDDEYLKFTFENQQMVVLRTATARASNLDILKMYGINYAASEDLVSLLATEQVF